MIQVEGDNMVEPIPEKIAIFVGRARGDLPAVPGAEGRLRLPGQRGSSGMGLNDHAHR